MQWDGGLESFIAALAYSQHVEAVQSITGSTRGNPHLMSLQRTQHHRASVVAMLFYKVEGGHCVAEFVP